MGCGCQASQGGGRKTKRGGRRVIKHKRKTHKRKTHKRVKRRKTRTRRRR
uniref:Uncharacterized protein n=1 Tax=viral metagenome TaxID=1070528 RepID=A0A6C0ESA9_9ZZZZ